MVKVVAIGKLFRGRILITKCLLLEEEKNEIRN
jgi:hypothetical protein